MAERGAACDMLVMLTEKTATAQINLTEIRLICAVRVLPAAGQEI
jgi:hypothetical protein